ncbi:histidine kinase, partial [Streptomyces sp. SID8455]|nr:histidine kinase [Streptomyces sp. SID8455]
SGEIESMRRRLLRELAFTEEARLRLDAQAADLQRSNAELEQFAYVASHDLQEPLRKVSSFTQLLQRRYGGQLDERADQYIDFAVDG